MTDNQEQTSAAAADPYPGLTPDMRQWSTVREKVPSGLLLYREGTTGQLVCVLLCAALIAAILSIAARDCRCPSCGKRIISGVLVLDTCPRCKRNLYTGDKPKKAKKR